MKIGIDIGGSHTAIGIINDENIIIQKFEKNYTFQEKENILQIVENFIKESINLIKNEYEIELIGVAVPGATKDGKIVKTVNLGVNDYNISKFIQSIIDVPVIVRNDGKAAAIAEYYNLISVEKEIKDINVLFLNIGTGIGGAVIYNGKLLQGKQFEGFELGHTIIKKDGIMCKCGKKGCFERYGSILEYKNKVKHRLNIDMEINGDELRDIMKERKDEIKDIDEEYISDLCIGISNFINIFEPDVIIIGGGFSHFSYMFVDKMKDVLLNSSLLFNKRNHIDIRTAKLGNDAGIIGATIEM